MKKKLLVCATVFCLLAAAIISCNTEDDDEEQAESVTLNKSYVNLIIGDNPNNSTSLTATVLPATITKKVSWSSSDTSIVTVDENGLLAAVGRGSASVLAQVDSAVAVATIVVTGIDDGSASVSNILLTRDKVNMLVQDEVQLHAVVVAEDDVGDVVWSSTNETVAVVSNNGLVIARNTGSATISATIPNSNKTANCTITVTELAAGETVPEITSLTVSETEVSLLVGESTVIVPQLNDGAICSDTTNKLVWGDFLDKTIASVENGVITGLSVGKGKAGTTTIKVFRSDDGTTTINGLAEEITVTVYKPVESVSFMKDSTLVTELPLETTSDANTDITVRVLPLESQAKVDCESEKSEIAIASVDENTGKLTITPTGVGTTNIIVTSVADPTKSAKLKVTVTKK